MPLRLDWAQSFVSDRGLLSTAELYHENSKVRPFEADWGMDLMSAGMTEVYRSVRNPYKQYVRCERTALPRSRRRGELARILRHRRSVREYATTPITRAALGE